MAKQTFQIGIDFIANVNDLQSKIKTVTGDIAKMGSTSAGSWVQKHFDRLTQSVQNLQTKAQQPITSQAEFNKLTSELNKAESEYNNLIASVERMRNMSAGQKISILPENEQNKIRQAAQALELYEQEEKKATQSAKQLEAATEKAFQAQNKAGAAKSTWKALEKEYDESKAKLDKLRAASLAVGNAQSKLDDAIAAGAGEQEITQLKLQLEQAKGAAQKLNVVFQEGVSPVESMKAAVTNLNNETNKLATRKTNLKQDYEEAKRSATELKNQATALEQQLGKTGSNIQLEQAFERLKTKAKELGIDITQIKDSGQIEELKNKLIQLETQGLAQADREVDELANSLHGDLRNGLNQTRQSLDQTTQSFNKFNQQAQEVDQLKSQLGYFFSLTNSVYLLRSALQSAFETVKELDAVMTETAVVTDFSVGDMWEKLPEYATAASNLGSSITDVYSATTLYYQQGLKTEAAMSVGIETMKMARIAGMEAEEATQAMTAALRGFNMEVNETNALRVNDVYSNLAAITAADTEQIATAMSKTASIAASANMEFETTAALLSQIIETTQEAPETAGTALKTIVARFSEVKELKNQGISTGKDEEGEDIDVNKIQTALRSVGISMDDFFAGTEGLDSVLMRLAEKWGSLDFETQRYIATMAAGSRQQSRFIAMMSDYERTTELVSAAQNSAGASSKQFEKTMESLEAKLNKLKVAWDQFTMGIANNELIKTGIDLLTGFLETINKLLEGLPGLTKSFASLALVFVALRAGGALVNNALSGISASISKGLIDTATETGIIKKAAETGAKAGIAAAQGTAAGIQNPAAEAGLFKSYQILLWKVQSKLPAVDLKVTMYPQSKAAIDDYQRELAHVNTQLKELTVGTKAYNDMVAWKKKLIGIMANEYRLEGAAIKSLNFDQQQLIKEKMVEGVLDANLINLLGTEGLIRYANALATNNEEEAQKQLNWAKQTEQNLKKGGIVGFLTEIGLRAMNKTTTEGETVSLWELIAAKWEEVKVQLAKNSAMWAGIAVVIAYVAAIALLIVGIAKIGEAWKNSTIDAQIAKTDELLSDLREEANAAAQQMSEISDARKNLEDMNKTLSELKKGTTEWKEQLAKTNTEVLNLLDTYPELAGYIIRGSEGQMQISDEGWDAVYQNAEQRLYAANQAAISAQAKKTDLEQTKEFREAQDTSAQLALQREDYYKTKEAKTAAMFTGAGVVGLGGVIGGGFAGAKLGAGAGSFAGPLGALIGLAVGAVAGAAIGLGISVAEDALDGTEQDKERRATGGLTQDEFTEFAAKASQEGLSLAGGATEAEMHQIYTSLGYNEEDWSTVWANMRNMGSEFDELAAASLKATNANEAYTESILRAAAANDPELANNDFSEAAIVVQKQNDKNMQTEIDETTKSILEDEKYFSGKEDTPTDELISEYVKVSQRNEEEVRKAINDGALTNEMMARTIATQKKTDKSVEEMKSVSKELDKIIGPDKKTNSLFNVLSVDGQMLRQEDINDFKNIAKITDFNNVSKEDQKKAVEEFLKSKNTSLEALNLADGEDWQIIWENFSKGSEDFSSSAERLTKWGGQLDERVNIGVVNSLTNKISEQTNQGATGTTEILSQIQSIIDLGDLDAEQAQLFYEALSSIDWDNTAEVKTLSSNLEMLGLNMDLLGNAINGLEEDIIDFADSTYNLTLEQKGQLVENTRDLIQNLQEKGAGMEFTEEQIKMFTEDIQKDMVMVGERYFYSGSKTTQQLIDDVVNTSEVKVSTESQKEAYENKTTMENTQGFVSTSTVSKQENAAYSGANISETDVVNSEYYKNFMNRGIVSEIVTSNYSTYDQVVGEGKTYSSYNDLLSKNTNAEASDPYLAKIMNLARYGSLHGLPGLEEDFEYSDIDSLMAWYEGLESGNKAYMDMVAGATYISDNNQIYSDIDKYLIESVYDEDGSGFVLDFFSSGNNMLNAVTGGQTVGWNNFYTSDWDILDKIASGTYQIASEDGKYGKNEVGAEVLSTITLNRLYDTYIKDGTAQTSDEKVAQLTDFFEKIKNDSDNMSNKDYYQEMSLKTGQELFDASHSNLSTESESANKFIEAQVNSISGGKEMIADWVEQIEKSNEQTTANEKLIKTLGITYDRTNKKIDSLNSTLEESVEDFKKGTSGGQSYYKALSKITSAAQEVFGDTIDDTYVELHKDWFIALSEGGEAAQAAYDAINKDIALTQLNMLNLGVDTNKVSTIMDNALNSIEPGQAMDLTSLYGQLMGIENMTEAAAKNIMEQWGFTLSYDIKEVWVDDKGNIYEKNPPPGAVKTQLISGARESAAGSGSSSRGGGGGSKYENGYDKYHNTLEEINDLLRERERLERRYQRLLDRGTASAYELKEISQTTVTNLEQEIARHKIVQQGRREQIAELVAANESKLGKYVQAEKLENGEYSIRIDWDLIEGVKNSKTGESIDEFYDELKEYMESDYDMQNEILDKEDEIFDKLQEGKDEYLDLEDQVKEAIIQSKQEQINELSNINDSINDANSNILDSMQKQIDDARQARENEKTEEELSDKQRRLAYLQQDTSGANALEILNLQKEIEEGQESYTDQLIDQKISELQEQNDLAAEQRQRQIDILQAQLDEYAESSRIWQDVANLIVGGTDEKGGLIAGSDLDQLLKSAEAFEGMSKIQQMDWMKETNNLIASALTWLSEGAVSTFKTGQQIQFTDAEGNIQTGTADVNGNVKTENGIYENVGWNVREGRYTTSESTEDAIKKKEKEDEEKRLAEEAKMHPYKNISEITDQLKKGSKGANVRSLQTALNELINAKLSVDGDFGNATFNALKKYQKVKNISQTGILDDATKAAFYAEKPEDLTAFKTGGLADFTGPAWLDGTKSRPEYILNADQTKAFFNLIDVLGSLQTNSGKTVENSGDKSYDIDINVESIGSDYDVEQLADVVKRLINEDARYRNNNAINLMR